MKPDRIERIRNLLLKSGLEWIFAVEADERARGLAAEFDEAQALYRVQVGRETDFLEAAETDPGRYQAFLQSIGLPMSPQMRVVIWRMLEGEKIQKLEFVYDQGGTTTFRIQLSGDDDLIQATDAWDTLLLPQLSYIVANERLELGPIRPWFLPPGAETLHDE